jgi:hypothetical protein
MPFLFSGRNKMRKIIGNILGSITALLGIQRLFGAMYCANIPFLKEGVDMLYGQAFILLSISAILFTIANVKRATQKPSKNVFFDQKLEIKAIGVVGGIGIGIGATILLVAMVAILTK